MVVQSLTHFCFIEVLLGALREAAGYLRIWLGIDRSWIGPRCCPHRSALLRRSELGVQAVVGSILSQNFGRIFAAALLVAVKDNTSARLRLLEVSILSSTPVITSGFCSGCRYAIILCILPYIFYAGPTYSKGGGLAHQRPPRTCCGP